MALTIGSIVRPANDGENSCGILKWSNLRGRVIDVWYDCGELRAEVRWNQNAPYPTVVPSYFLKSVTD